jgi:hypothetical protein
MVSRDEKRTCISSRSFWGEGWLWRVSCREDVLKETTWPKDCSFLRTAVDSPKVAGGGEMTRRVARYWSDPLVIDMVARVEDKKSERGTC